jgi:uncharacterized protein (TIGR00730 family)
MRQFLGRASRRSARTCALLKDPAWNAMMRDIPTRRTLRELKAIAVFCGSSLGGSDAYAEGARALGTALAKAGVVLIYGGTTKGLMGVVADAALGAGGEAHGVITQRLHARGHSHAGLTRHEIADTLRARKQRMAELADAFIALPGGVGTLEEFMEVWAQNQLGEFDKPAGLLDSAGFYQPFLAFVDRMIEAKFLPAPHRRSIEVDADPAALISKLQRHRRIETPKWL